MSTFYINGTTLSNSTAVFTDSGLTTPAADGFYAAGTISREQANSVLLPAQTCPSCAEPCGGSIAASGSQGLYKVDIDFGGTNTDVGACVIRFNPASVPDGILVEFNGILYNKLSSQNYGLLQGSNTQLATYIGAIGSDGCGVNSGNYSQTIAVFNYAGGSFSNTGTSQLVTIPSGQSKLTQSQPGNSYMVIPKTTGAPSLANIQFIGPCSGTVFSFDIGCPALLPSLWSNVNPKTTRQLACESAGDGLIYHVPVNSSASAGNVKLHDYLFNDQFGADPVADGFYLLPNGSTVQCEFGIVTAVADSCAGFRLLDCNGTDLWTVNDRFQGQFSVGDVVRFRVSGANGPQGNILCGTIQQNTSGEDTNAYMYDNDIVADCSQSAKCDQPV